MGDASSIEHKEGHAFKRARMTHTLRDVLQALVKGFGMKSVLHFLAWHCKEESRHIGGLYAEEHPGYQAAKKRARALYETSQVLGLLAIEQCVHEADDPGRPVEWCVRAWDGGLEVLSKAARERLAASDSFAGREGFESEEEQSIWKAVAGRMRRKETDD